MINELIFHAMFWLSVSLFIQWMQSREARFQDVPGGAVEECAAGFKAYLDIGSELKQIQPGRIFRTLNAAKLAIEMRR